MATLRTRGREDDVKGHRKTYFPLSLMADYSRGLVKDESLFTSQGGPDDKRLVEDVVNR